MWWKIYFWIIALLLIIGSFAILEFVPLAFMDMVSLVLEFATLLGIFAYAYKKQVLDKRYWKTLFYINIALTIIGLLELYALPKNFLSDMFPFLQTKIPLDDGSILFATLLYGPAYYALYLLGFSKKTK